MQVPEKTGVEISEYDRKQKEGTWEGLTYRERCPMCGRSNCAVKHGSYNRRAFDEKGNFIKDLKIQRWRCRMKAKKTKTFSALPEQLMPYSRYPVKTVTGILSRWKRFGGDTGKALETTFKKIENISDELLDTGESQVYRFIKIFERARDKYIIWKRLNRGWSLESFIGLCSLNNYCHAEALSMSYYAGNGGYINNSQFLFGRASQFRNRRQ